MGTILNSGQNILKTYYFKTVESGQKQAGVEGI
jgi:hypothetical protein